MSPPKKTKLALIFPPAMHPLTPPLGIAALAAYVERQTGARVKCFDLNLALFEQALKWMADGRLKVKFKDSDHETTARRAIQAVAALKSKDSSRGFSGIEEYDLYAADYSRFENLIAPLFTHQTKLIAAGKPVSPLIGRFFDDLIRPVIDFAPQMAGLSILFSQQMHPGLALAKKLKALGMTTVLGGATLAVMPDARRLIEAPLNARAGGKDVKIDAAGFIDFIVVGEGEMGLAGLAAGKGRDIETVPGLIARRNGRLVINPPAAVRDVSSLPPPDFSHFDLKAYHSPKPMLPYLSARGCYWQKCAFCTHRQTYLDYRRESPEQTIERLFELKRKHAVDLFALADEMVHPKRMDRLADLILASGQEIRFSAYASPTGAFTQDLLQRSARAGLRVLMWGIESASQRVLRLMNKGTRPENFGRILADSHAAGIANLVFVMFGFPTEDRHELESTVNFIDRNKDHIAALSKSRFLLLQNAPMLGDPHKYHLKNIRPRQGDDLLTMAYDYDVERGLSQREVDVLYKKKLRGMTAGPSSHVAVLRDHLLALASFEPRLI